MNGESERATGFSQIWLITDQLPYPPRNGITLPVANYLDGLRRQHDVRLILLVDAAHPPDPDDLARNELRYGRISQISLVRDPPLTRAVREIMGRSSYYHGWRLAPGRTPLTPPPGAAWIVSPMSAAATWHGLQRNDGVTHGVSIAAVNDCTAAQYWHRGRQLFRGGFWRPLMDRWRAGNIARIERRVLSGYDHILLQTKTDLELMRQLVGEETARRVTLAPNGVRAELFAVAPDRKSRHVVLVSELSGEYAPVARWLVGEVWPMVRRAQPDAALRIIGRGADDRLIALMNTTPGVCYVPFVDDLTEVYRNTRVAISPVFKGYGLINKTLEAMASSIPVVGGASAFNGIDGFVPSIDGIQCATKDAARYAAAITELIQDPALCERMGESGRLRVRGSFAWERTIKTLESLLVTGRG